MAEKHTDNLHSAQASHRQSEERFDLMVQGVTDYAISLLSPDGYVNSWNQGAERIKGYRADDIIGQHFSMFYPPEAIARSWPEHEQRPRTQVLKHCACSIEPSHREKPSEQQS